MPHYCYGESTDARMPVLLETIALYKRLGEDSLHSMDAGHPSNQRLLLPKSKRGTPDMFSSKEEEKEREGKGEMSPAPVPAGEPTINPVVQTPASPLRTENL